MKIRINEKLVSRGNRILCGLEDRSLGKNELIKETGSDRKKAIPEVIPFLIKGNFVNIVKNKKIHKQKEFVVLTRLCHNWVTFIKTINQFCNDFENLIENKETDLDNYQNIFANTAIRNYFSDTNNNNNKEEPHKALSVRDNLLRGKGWSADEISKFEIWHHYTHEFIHYVIDFVIEIIIFRYHKFLIGHEINDYADKFILNFIETQASFYIKKKIELRNKEYGIDINDKNNENNILVKRYEANEYQNAMFKEKHKEILFGKFGELIIPSLDNNRIKDLLQKISRDIISLIDVDLKYFKTELDEMEKDNKLIPEDYSNEEEKHQLIKFYKSLLR